MQFFYPRPFFLRPCYYPHLPRRQRDLADIFLAPEKYRKSPFPRCEDNLGLLTSSSRPTRKSHPKVPSESPALKSRLKKSTRPCLYLPRSTENHSNPALRPLKTQQNEQIPVAKYTIPPKSRTSHPDLSHEHPDPSHELPDPSHKPPAPSHKHPETHCTIIKKRKML